MRRKSVQRYKMSRASLQRKSEKCVRIDIFNKGQRGFAISTYHFRYICRSESVYESFAYMLCGISAMLVFCSLLCEFGASVLFVNEFVTKRWE